MDWIKDFYEKQFDMMKKDGNEIDSYHDRTLEKMKKMAEKPFHSILELGAGSGEFAVNAAINGHDVTAVELVPSLIDHMNKLKEKYNGELTVIQGDFYQVEINRTFDVVCYLDGFGIGSDQDQRKLLERISNWLNPDGCVLIDIYTPWYWSKNIGQEMKFDQTYSRKYDFDFTGCRMLDTWFNTSSPDQQVTQSLRCYSPQDLIILLENTGLKLVDLKPGGAMNYDTWEYKEDTSLGEAMSYMAKLVNE